MTKIEAPVTWYDYTYAYPDGYIEDGIDLSDIVFYVGKGQKGRIDAHEREAAKGCVCQKCQEIRKVWANGKPIKKRIVFETLQEAEALENEKKLIALHISKHLVNIASKSWLCMPKSEGRLTMEEKEIYTLQELYDDLPCTLKDLGKMAGLNEVTVARIRDGESTRRSTANKLLRAMSKVYGRPDNRPLTLRHVTGINVQRNLREEKKEAKREKAEVEQEEKGAA